MVEEKCIDINVVDNYNRNLLHHISYNDDLIEDIEEYLSILEYSIQNGIHLDVCVIYLERYDFARTPLHFNLASSETFEGAKTLINAGANVFIPTWEGKLPIDLIEDTYSHEDPKYNELKQLLTYKMTKSHITN